MRPYFFIASLIVLTVSGAVGQECNKKAAEAYLDSLFLNRQYLSYDSTLYPSYSKKLTRINTPLLNKYLPDYCFFKTTFIYHSYEYREVRTLLALSNIINRKNQLLHSPIFSQESPSFFQLFYEIKLPDTSQCVAFAKEIVNLISNITYAGHVNRLINLKERNTISFELWQNELSFRFYDFNFDSTHQLIQVKIKDGVKRLEMQEDYKRH